MRALAGAEGFWVAELQVRQLKIGSKSCFGTQLQNERFFYSFLSKKCFVTQPILIHAVSIEYIILADSDLANLLIGNQKSCQRMC